jgi:chromate reductase
VSDHVSILAFAGSLRRKSLNRGLIRAAIEMAPANVTTTAIELNDLPFYDADHDGPASPPAVTAFRRAIVAADALLIATPEYNYSISGVLKNAIDWASRKPNQDEAPALQGKPAAIMGAGGRFGTVRAQAHLRYILLHNDVKLVNKPEIMIARAWEHFDADGNLTDDATRGQVAELVTALAAWTRLLRKA